MKRLQLSIIAIATLLALSLTCVGTFVQFYNIFKRLLMLVLPAYLHIGEVMFNRIQIRRIRW